MPVLHIRKPSEAPLPSRSSRAVQEQQRRYDDFVRKVDVSDVGDLELELNESTRSVKVRLRRASTRLNIELDIWDADGHIYFRRVLRRGRPRKQT